MVHYAELAELGRRGALLQRVLPWSLSQPRPRNPGSSRETPASTGIRFSSRAEEIRRKPLHRCDERSGVAAQDTDCNSARAASRLGRPAVRNRRPQRALRGKLVDALANNTVLNLVVRQAQSDSASTARGWDEKLGALRSEHAETQAQRRTLSAEVDQLRQALADSQADSASTARAWDDKLAAMRSEHAETQAQRRTLSAEVDQLRQALADSQADSASTARGWDEKLGALRSEHAETQAQRRTLSAEVDQLRQALADTHAAASDRELQLRSRLAVATSDLEAQKTARKEELAAKRSKWKKKRQRMTEDVASKDAAIEELQTSLSLQKAEQETTTNNLKAVSDKLEGLECCSICMESEKTVLLEPCMHLCMCKTCEKQYFDIKANKKCPYCQKVVKKRRHVFLIKGGL
eukprot:TRINITY_DN4833_c0_g1_i4.p1 TRINITY_DN4833_c0_g1~~TRINITY_DN4833_c0_g1_i4.p1  ORF type:complete len:407 (-),score=95.53 TRINITY_DN4833_c0_g1_i4:219-1439(-)